MSRILTDYDLDDALLLFVIDAYIILDDYVFVFKVVKFLLFRTMPHGSIHSPSAINFFKSIGASPLSMSRNTLEH